MSLQPTLAITGSTGALGRMIATELANAGLPQRLLVRTPSKAPRLVGSTVHEFSYSDRSAALDALTGVETLLMVSAAESEDRVEHHRAFIDAARESGVNHIVYTSFFGASRTATFTLARDHYETEQYITASGITHTFLRDNLYIDFLGALVGEDGVIRGPAGDGGLAAVAREDIARVASAVLRHPESHANATYDLTGEQALTMAEIAAVLGTLRGSPVTYYDETLSEAYDSRAKYQAPLWQVDAWVSTYTAIAAGEMSATSTAVRDITGRTPLTLAQFSAQSSMNR